MRLAEMRSWLKNQDESVSKLIIRMIIFLRIQDLNTPLALFPLIKTPVLYNINNRIGELFSPL